MVRGVTARVQGGASEARDQQQRITKLTCRQPKL
jgi:hypothetical protein